MTQGDVTTPAGSRGGNAERLFPWALALIMVAAIAIRLAYLYQFSALPFFDQPVGDSAAHLGRAAAIAHGEFLPRTPFYYCSIFYPYFLAFVLGGLHGSLFTVSLLQLLAGVATVALLALAARSLFGATAGLVTAALAAFYGPSAFLEADILGVAGGQLALGIAMLACVVWWVREDASPARRPALLIVAGLAFGLASVERPNLLLVAAAAGLWLMLVAPRGRARTALALGAGVALPILVVLGLNVWGSGQWVPFTTSSGINLSLGNHAGADGTYDEPWEREAPEFSARHIEPEEAMIAWASRKLGRAVTARQASAYWAAEAMSYIRSHPRETAAVSLRKAALMLNSGEVPNHLDFEFIRERAPALWLMPVRFALVLGLAAFGAFEALRRRRRAAAIDPAEALRGRRRAVAAWLLLGMAAAVWLSVIPFTVADRYRAPMVPPLMVLAGAGGAFLLELRRGEARRAIGPIAVGLVALLLSSVPIVRPLRGRDFWMFAQAYESRGQLPQAISAYDAAVREEPDNGALLNNLANALKRAGDYPRAIALLRHAVEVEPGLAYPHKSLGVLLVNSGQLDSALVEFARANRIDSTDVEVVAMMGAIEAERGNAAAARASFEQARRLAPDDPKLLRLIAHYQPGLDAKR